MSPVPHRSPGRPSHRGGFTLAEVAVTLVIVGITLLWILEGMNKAKMTAAQSHSKKIAAELAEITLGEIEAGLYWDDIDENGLDGNYAEEGYESYYWEVVVGDETFPDMADDEPMLEYDTFAEQRRREEEARADSDEDDEEVEEPYEKVRIRVTFPRFTDEKPEVILERWIPWDQVYGPSDEDLDAAAGGSEASE